MPGSSGALGIITERDVPATMRDGVVLRADVFRPDAAGAFPGLLLRTPYGKHRRGGHDRFVRSGYAVVVQDSRGRYTSDGNYVPFSEEETGDAEDGYDTVEWLAAQSWCNGRVGTTGASYDGWMQWQLAKLRPPHLVAMCAQTIPLELTAVDWPGGFRPGRRVRWWMANLGPDIRRRAGEPGPHTPDEAAQLWDETAQSSWLGFLPWLDLPKYLPKGLAEYAEDWLREPNRKPWKLEDIHCQIDVPNLDFSGWYDHCNDTIRHLALMQKNGRSERARSQTRLVAGPWNHPGLGKSRIGDIDFGPQAEIDKQDMIIRWFDFWLKDLPNGFDQEPAVRYYVMGSNQWRSAETWPPPIVEPETFHLDSGGEARAADGDGALTATAVAGPGGPAGGADSDAYTYDPRDPVPTLWSAEWFTAPADRRVLEHRSDILYYRSQPLTESIEIAGYPEAVLYVSSTAPDTDFFARLVDEYPDEPTAQSEAPWYRSRRGTSAILGPAREIAYGMTRARHRNSLDVEELLTPGEVTMLRIVMGPTACRFQAGHRIRLEITSSDYPNHDRNHNVGRNDLADIELAATENRIFHTAEHPSVLILPVDRTSPAPDAESPPK